MVVTGPSYGISEQFVHRNYMPWLSDSESGIRSSTPERKQPHIDSPEKLIVGRENSTQEWGMSGQSLAKV